MLFTCGARERVLLTLRVFSGGNMFAFPDHRPLRLLLLGSVNVQRIVSERRACTPSHMLRACACDETIGACDAEKEVMP